jgi:hypothetical protein
MLVHERRETVSVKRLRLTLVFAVGVTAVTACTAVAVAPLVNKCADQVKEANTLENFLALAHESGTIDAMIAGGMSEVEAEASLRDFFPEIVDEAMAYDWASCVMSEGFTCDLELDRPPKTCSFENGAMTVEVGNPFLSD